MSASGDLVPSVVDRFALPSEMARLAQMRADQQPGALVITPQTASRWIGSDLFPFTVPLAKGAASGYMGIDPLTEERAAEQVALFQEEAARENVHLFCGVSPRVLAMAEINWERGVYIFALVGGHAADIADLCDVGVPEYSNSVDNLKRLFREEHGPGDWTAAAQFMAGPKPEAIRSGIRGFMERVAKRILCRVDFADPKGLKAHFLRKVNEDEATWLEKEIAKVDIEAFDVADPLTMKEYILQQQRLVLWWD